VSDETEVSKFIERMQTPVKSLGIQELKQREEMWRALWGWIDDDVKFFVLRTGSMFRVMKRDYKGSVGELGACKFELKELELAVYEKTYNYVDGKNYFERKVLKIPGGTIMMLEYITERELAELVEIPEVEGLGVEAEIG